MKKFALATLLTTITSTTFAQSFIERPTLDLYPGEASVVTYDLTSISGSVTNFQPYLRSVSPSAGCSKMSSNSPITVSLVDVTTGKLGYQLGKAPAFHSSILIDENYLKDQVPAGTIVWGPYNVAGHIVKASVLLDKKIRRCVTVQVDWAGAIGG